MRLAWWGIPGIPFMSILPEWLWTIGEPSICQPTNGTRTSMQQTWWLSTLGSLAAQVCCWNSLLVGQTMLNHCFWCSWPVDVHKPAWRSHEILKSCCVEGLSQNRGPKNPLVYHHVPMRKLIQGNLNIPFEHTQSPIKTPRMKGVMLQSLFYKLPCWGIFKFQTNKTTCQVAVDNSNEGLWNWADPETGNARMFSKRTLYIMIIIIIIMIIIVVIYYIPFTIIDMLLLYYCRLLL